MDSMLQDAMSPSSSLPFFSPQGNSSHTYLNSRSVKTNMSSSISNNNMNHLKMQRLIYLKNFKPAQLTSTRQNKVQLKS